MSKHKFALSSSAALALLCVAGMVEAAVGDVVLVADGLHSPRGLDFAPNGQLFVAEAGDNVTGYSETGVVSRIDYWLDAQYARRPVLTGLPTYGDVGPADISFHGMKGYVPIGLGTNANNRDALGGANKKELLGSLISFYPGFRHIEREADVADLERDYPNADGYIFNGIGRPEDPIDSNPFGVLALPGRQIVVDAGANSVYAIRNNGSAHLLAAFTAEDTSQGQSQHVPSRVAQGPDGYLYVGEEAFSLLQAYVYKIPPGGCDTASPTDCKSRVLTDKNGVAITFGHIMDLEFDQNGNLYVLQFPGFGGPPSGNDLVKVDRKGNKTVIYSGLSNPGGMALSQDGRYAYVSNRTTCYGTIYQGFAPPTDPPTPPPLNCVDPANPAPPVVGEPGLAGQVLRISLTAADRWSHHGNDDKHDWDD